MDDVAVEFDILSTHTAGASSGSSREAARACQPPRTLRPTDEDLSNHPAKSQAAHSLQEPLVIPSARQSIRRPENCIVTPFMQVAG